jgi:hypothetical protein
MSRWLTLAKAPEGKNNTSFDNMTEPDRTSAFGPEGTFCQVLSNCQVEVHEKPCGPPTDDMRHGFAVNGCPKTWTGNVVSLEEWRGLSHWQKHGPDGRIWCGICRAWLEQCNHTLEVDSGP